MFMDPRSAVAELFSTAVVWVTDLEGRECVSFNPTLL